MRVGENLAATPGGSMNYIFLGTTLTMVLVASAFVALPLARRKPSLKIPIILMAIVVPINAIGLYAVVGSPDALNAGAAHSDKTKSAESNSSIPSVSVLVNGLQARLEQEPNDAGGWLLLAKSYQHLGQHDRAQFAYERAKALGQTDAQFESSSENGSIVSNESKTTAGSMLRGRVTLAEELVAQVNADDTVFIFAKESRSHRMPVAAIRRPASALPIDFELTNSDAMIAGTDLANYATLVVTARISPSGRALDTGWEAWTDPITPGSDQMINLTIASGNGE
jgi:hypothetical protein